VDRIKDIESLLTMVGGKVVYGRVLFAPLAAAPTVSQDWLPVREYGEYYKRGSRTRRTWRGRSRGRS